MGLFDSAQNPQQLLKGGLQPKNNPIYGVHKAQVTGNFMAADNQYVEVIVHAVPGSPRPCYAFGGRVAAPSKEFIEKYKTQIFLWVCFEEAMPDTCIWLGWNWLDGKQQEIPDFPNAAYYRTIWFKEVFNDDKKEYSVGYYGDNSEEAYINISEGGIRLHTSKMIKVFSEESFSLETKKATMFYSDMVMGSSAAKDAAVLGNTLNAYLNSTNAVLEGIANSLQQIAMFASSGVAGVNPAAAASLTQNAAGVTALLTEINNLKAISQNKTYLSKKLKLD